MSHSFPSRSELDRAVRAILDSQLSSSRHGQEIAATTSRPGAPPVELAPEVQTLARVIDHTQLRPEAAKHKIEALCDEALQWKLGAVCVNPAWVTLVSRRLKGSSVNVATVCAFPLGATLTSAKQAEAEAAIAAGASEIDMVMNISAMKSGDCALVEADIAGVVEVCHAANAILKVILENCYLSQEDKIEACKIAQRAGADFVKTSSGFGPSGATRADVRLMREVVGENMGVKAAGGIRSLSDALDMLQAGATRLGTSAGHILVEEAARLMNINKSNNG
jgi:deoxyribose-phosphate aldolase